MAAVCRGRCASIGGMLQIHALIKRFGDQTILQEIDLSVASGSIYALIGPNGSGKTTLTKIVAGLVQPSDGTVTIAGVDMVQDPVQAKQSIGYIPDNPEAWGKLTGREFLHFVGALYGMSPARRAKRIDELLPVFQLAEIADRYFEHYSRGNRQKFSIIAALLHEPRLLLIDEPIVGLDPESVTVFEGLLREFAAAGGSVLITTHTLLVAEHIADTVGLLADGSLVASNSIAALRETAGLTSDASLDAVYHALVGQRLPTTAPAASLTGREL